MKKLLIATTALTAMAGASFAEVTVTGNGRMGIVGNEDSANLTSRVRISFDAAKTLDNGLTFGGSIRADNAGAGGVSLTGIDDEGAGLNQVNGNTGGAGSVFVSGDNWQVSVGDIGSAAKKAAGHVSGVGFAGLGSGNSFSYIDSTDPAALLQFSTAGATLYVSAGRDLDEEYAVGLSYALDAITLGAGYETNGTDSQITATAAANLGGLDIKVGYATRDVAAVDAVDAVADDLTTIHIDETVEAVAAVPANTQNQIAVSASYSVDAVTGTVYYRQAGDETDNYGVGISYDLGGGASLAAGFASLNEATQYDLGFNFSF